MSPSPWTRRLSSEVGESSVRDLIDRAIDERLEENARRVLGGLKEEQIRSRGPLEDRLTVGWRGYVIGRDPLLVKDELARTLPGYPWGHEQHARFGPSDTSTETAGVAGGEDVAE
jgi:hypothetical protein